MLKAQPQRLNGPLTIVSWILSQGIRQLLSALLRTIDAGPRQAEGSLPQWIECFSSPLNGYGKGLILKNILNYMQSIKELTL